MKYLSILFSTFLLFACSSNSDTYTLSGKAMGFEDGTKIIVSEVINNQPKAIDTLVVQSESFIGEYTNSEVLTLNLLQVENIKSTILYFPENINLKATIYKDSIKSSFVKGGTQNDSYREFTNQLKRFNKIKSEKAQLFKQARREQDGISSTKLTTRTE